MNALMLVAGILQTLALVSRNPAIGFDATKYAAVLEFLARLVEKGNSAVDELRALRSEVEGMLTENRPPTDAEVANWKSRSDAAHAALQAMKAKRPGAPDEPPPADARPADGDGKVG